jgi:hypothetical protein
MGNVLEAGLATAREDKRAPFQAHSFHHRLRQNESYSEKWDYVRMNPVRAGLVADPDRWPYQGALNELDW